MQNHQDMTEREQRIRNRAAEIDAVPFRVTHEQLALGGCARACAHPLDLTAHR